MNMSLVSDLKAYLILSIRIDSIHFCWSYKTLTAVLTVRARCNKEHKTVRSKASDLGFERGDKGSWKIVKLNVLKDQRSTKRVL